MAEGQLERIISNTTKQPTIVNESSNFVVSTYWWGRGNYNQNTARPCIFFYEKMIQTAIKNIVKNMEITTTRVLLKTPTMAPEKINELVLKSTFNIISKNYDTPKYRAFLEQNAKEYIDMVREYCKIDKNDPDVENKNMICLEKLKASGKTPPTYEYKSLETVKSTLFKILNEIFILCRSEIISMYKLNIAVIKIRDEYTKAKDSGVTVNVDEYNANLKDLSTRKKTLNATINSKLRTKQQFNASASPEFAEHYQNMSIFDILNAELRFLNPIRFEEMIAKWEAECAKFNCNYLSVEYPEFAQPGGYQMAINAKPLFIQKALTLCGTRGVLYIDGDMFIRKYPSIFDMTDVDFMARGWWMDPRSSEEMEESFMFDPYTFETSGGTMFFSQSYEAKQIISMWVYDSAKPSNKGKADDRILSLVFNAKQFLFNMKIIQLPIEYLWLSLSYDNRLTNDLYGGDAMQMTQSIFIEHPECLTSEDTAAGAGASSDRTPNFYSFIEKELFPASEEFHEFLFFDSKEQTASFRDYLRYMGGKQYINDGNPDLIALGYVDPANPENNEQALYVIPYDNKYGNKMYFKSYELESGDENYTITQIAEINDRESKKLNLSNFALTERENNCVEFNNAENIPSKILIRLLIRLLDDGKTVIYNPSHLPSYMPELYQQLMTQKDNLFRSLDFVFTPDYNNKRSDPIRSDLLKPNIMLNQAMLFRPCTMLINYLKMFLSLNDLSGYISYSSYEFMSRTRVGLNVIVKKREDSAVVGGAPMPPNPMPPNPMPPGVHLPLGVGDTVQTSGPITSSPAEMTNPAVSDTIEEPTPDLVRVDTIPSVVEPHREASGTTQAISKETFHEVSYNEFFMQQLENYWDGLNAMYGASAVYGGRKYGRRRRITYKRHKIIKTKKIYRRKKQLRKSRKIKRRKCNKSKRLH